ncbi:MAG: sulfatase-like hydrolase/transferase [Planctomycetes bacterium]|nr:sulfatase-like hydrolase/transferase [Planctomycetota bacterium]
MSPDYFTLAEAFREAGYATAHFGKWHLGHNLPQNPTDRYEPQDQGFDFDFPHTPSAPGPGGGYLAPWKFIKDPNIIGKPGEHIEDRMSVEATKYIHAHKDQPFCISYWAYSVHSPWNARRDHIEYFKPKADPKNSQHNPLYAAMVRSLDDGVGRLLQAVDDAGLADNTIIVFFSDNGGWVYPPRATDPEGFTDVPATSNLPLRSGKASLYEGGTREPCIIVWPGKAKPGTVNDSLLQSTDFYPTLLSMCGLKPKTDIKLDGFDQSGILLGKPSPRDHVFCHFPHGSPNQAQNIPGFLPGTYVRKGDWKLIRFHADNDDGSDRFELYDLRDDLGETTNLASARPELVRELNSLITDFLNDTDAVIPVRNPRYSKIAVNAPGKAVDDEFPGLQGWKARGCDYTAEDGIVTLKGKSDEPFLGIAAGLSGPAAVKFRARCARGGGGKVEWLPSAGKLSGAKSAAFRLPPGDWQEVTVPIPAEGRLGITRLYLPAQQGAVEIDWIEIKGQGAFRFRRWEFEN